MIWPLRLWWTENSDPPCLPERPTLAIDLVVILSVLGLVILAVIQSMRIVDMDQRQEAAYSYAIRKHESYGPHIQKVEADHARMMEVMKRLERRLEAAGK